MPSDSANLTEAFLAQAQPGHRRQCVNWLAEGAEPPAWAGLQQAFLDMIDQYLEQETQRPAKRWIDTHEAGGAWRIAFAHLRIRPNELVARHMAGVIRRLRVEYGRRHDLRLVQL